MTKPKRVSKAAFDRWFTDNYGRPLTDKQISKLYRAKERAESAFVVARMRVDAALESAMAYEDTYSAWLASREANNA